MSDTITMAHGAGGKQSAKLIGEMFAACFGNPDFTSDDAAVMPAPEGRIAMSTDGFIVSPRFFPGGNIGKLAVCGTVNDLACMGARPLYLTVSFVIEEGFPMAELEEICWAMSDACREVGIRVVAGDTKVAGKGQVDGIFITTAGVGELLPVVSPAGNRARPGDVILVTRDIGRHGCTILLERNHFGIDAQVTSDCAPLWFPVASALSISPDIHVIRDATRGGVGTVLHEIAQQSQVGIELDAEAIPVSPEVRGVCGLLGMEPLYLACEGTMVMVVPKDEIYYVMNALKHEEHSKHAAIIGRVTEKNKGRVVMITELGAKTYLPQPGNELLPRIC